MINPEYTKHFNLVILGGIVILFVTGLFIHIENIDLVNLYREEIKYLKQLRDPTIMSNGATYLGTKFYDFELYDLDNNKHKLSHLMSSLKLIILFSVNDCSSCLSEYRLWSKLHEKYTTELLSVWAICGGRDRNAIEKFAKERNINFPIILDPENSVKSIMGFRTSPLRILVDDMNNILDISVTLTTNDQQFDFLSMIESRIKKIKETVDEKNCS